MAAAWARRSGMPGDLVGQGPDFRRDLGLGQRGLPVGLSQLFVGAERRDHHDRLAVERRDRPGLIGTIGFRNDRYGVPPNVAGSIDLVGGGASRCPDRELEPGRSLDRELDRCQGQAARKDIEIAELSRELAVQDIGLVGHHQRVADADIRKDDGALLEVGHIGGLQPGGRVACDDVGGIDRNAPPVGFFRVRLEGFQRLHALDELQLLLAERLDRARREDPDPLGRDVRRGAVVADRQIALVLHGIGRLSAGTGELRRTCLTRPGRDRCRSIGRNLSGRCAGGKVSEQDRCEQGRNRDVGVLLHFPSLSRQCSYAPSCWISALLKSAAEG
jgi:hypothetical protein